jgi:hypothetical protein
MVTEPVRPSVGEAVHYVSYGSADGRYESTCRAAIVTETHATYDDPSARGLCVLNPTGVFFDRNCAQSEDDHRGGTWHWPCIPNPHTEEKY